MSVPIDPDFLTFLRARLGEDLPRADRRAADARVDPEHAERGLLMLREVLATLDAGEVPDRMTRDLLVAAYSRHPDFRPEWNRWRRS